MTLKLSKGYYLIFAILTILTAFAVFWGITRIIDQEKATRSLRLKRANQIAATELEGALNLHVTLLSGIKALTTGSDEIPSRKKLKSFIETQLKDLDIDPPFSVSYIDTNHIFVYDFLLEGPDVDLLKGTSIQDIIGKKGIERMGRSMTQEKFKASNPTNLVEGKVALPFVFGVLDSLGNSRGYISSVVLFKPIVDRVYEVVDKEVFALSFQSGNGNYFDRKQSYNKQKIKNTIQDPEYFKNFDIPAEKYVFTKVPFYGNEFTVGTAFKQPYTYSTSFLINSALWFIAIVSFMLFLIRRYSFYERKSKKTKIRQERLSEVVDSKNKFFATIAHDLKVPLTSVLNFLDLLKEEKFQNNQTKTIIESLEASTINSISLLDNLNNWSKLRTGQIKFEPKNLDILTITKDQIRVQQRHLTEKGINIRVESSFKKTVQGDKNMIATVIRNLISNAIKFSNINSIIVIELSMDNENFSFSIEDNGIGIPNTTDHEPVVLSEIKKRLGTNNEKGSGLGLILCDQFISEHQGKLTIESKEGKGTIATFTLPLRQ